MLREKIARRILRHCVPAILAVGIGLPAGAAGENPLGTIMQAQAAHMDHEKAAMGTTVYPGDSFDTETGGTLRLRLGTNELSLLSRSGAVVSRNANAARVTVTGGTVEFSSAAAGQLEIETPLGIVHGAAGRSAFGDVTLTGPESMIVASHHGTLVVEHEGETYTVTEGKSYNVSLEPSDPVTSEVAAAAGTNDQDQQDPGTSHHHRKKLAMIIILGGAGAVVTYCLWGTAESPSGFCK